MKKKLGTRVMTLLLTLIVVYFINGSISVNDIIFLKNTTQNITQNYYSIQRSFGKIEAAAGNVITSIASTDYTETRDSEQLKSTGEMLAFALQEMHNSLDIIEEKKNIFKMKS